LLLASPLAARGGGADELPSDARLRTLLRSGEDRDKAALIKLGDRLFPAYERLLTDKTKNAEEIEGILHILRHVKTDRSQFVEHAVVLLASPISSTRRLSLHLLALIGREREASPVVALLSDEYVNYSAATALAAIGGSRELVAFDIWLMTSPHRKDEDLRQHVAKCRDELKQRLEKEKKPGK
jgi:hypothetical protein